MIFISEEEVEKHLDLEELLRVMESALIDLSSGAAVQPPRGVIAIPGEQAWFGSMPVVYSDVIGAKLVTVYPANFRRGLNTHQALIQLFDRHAGEPLAVLGGRTITAWRTAAVSALATRELASADAKVLAILGSGVQARTHLKMLRMERNFNAVRVWSRTRENAERFAEETGAEVTTAEEAVSGADVIVTVTHSSEPVLRGEWIKPGAHINAVGAVGLHARELDDTAMNDAFVVVESAEAAMKESADIVGSGAPIYCELGELLGRRKPKPQGRNTIYKSLGVAVEDIAAARMIYQRVMHSKGVLPKTR